MINHKYRLCLSSWGICIDLSCEIDKSNSPEFESLIVIDDLQLEYFKLGLRLSKQNIKVKLHELTYNPTDYQVEGLAIALLEMICKATNSILPLIHVEFIKAKNKYVFYLEIEKLVIQ